MTRNSGQQSRRDSQVRGSGQQAASQALAQLEQHLDVRLFHRTTCVMSLTDEGRQFLEKAQPALLGLKRALQTAKRAKEEIAGPLRIVGPRSTLQHVLWRLLSSVSSNGTSCRTCSWKTASATG